jgi:hypothetical protein
MVNVKRAIKQIRRSTVGKKLTRKTNRSNKQIRKHRGGAVYSFDFNDKIGGLAANVGLNGGPDGDCPKGNLAELGMMNYESAAGGRRKNKRSHKRSHKRLHSKSYSNSHKKSKSKKH